ncbi:hypothetical protein B0H11DRAFT_1735748 [Mycena galericulata]|nr:hypothetical protein B0H11DRAFT_1735748 [Mycena galericulata]
MASRVFKAAAPAPSPSSLAFRTTLAHLISPLRRVRPRVPFFKIEIHRKPTLALYRNLLRYAPDDNIRSRVQYLFRKHQHATGTEKTRKELLKGYKWLDAFQKARQGDEKQHAIMSRYSRLIAAKVDKEDVKRLARAEAAWQARLRSRPILTGAIVKPTLYMPPLPRMKPQPAAISSIIRTRMRTRERRMGRMEQLTEDINDLRAEAAFEEALGEAHDLRRVYSGEAAREWVGPLYVAQRELSVFLARDLERQKTPISPELQEIARAARREKIANKTRERMRERRGEVLSCTVKRARQGPPAHVLVHMSPTQRHVDKVVRRVGEVGYTGLVKLRAGVKLRDAGAGLARENSLDIEGERAERMRELEKEYQRERTTRLKRNQGVDPNNK